MTVRLAALVGLLCPNLVLAENQALTVYCSADEVFARPILAEFTRRTGIMVRPVFDTEAGKTTGLVSRLLAERARPRADLWWSGEVFGTLQLAEAGALAPSDASAAGLPDAFRDPERRWLSFALRARVIAYDPRRTSADQLPRRWAELSEPRFRGRIALADPRFGTTRGQMAVLADLWGENAFRAWLQGLRDNGARLADGNAHAVRLLSAGLVELAMSDSDDVIVARARGEVVDMHLPDLDAPGGAAWPGTLWIPNSVALVSGSENLAAASRLAEYLASAEVELQLARSDSANIPVRKESRDALMAGSTRDRFGVLLEAYRRSKPVNYAKAAARLREADRLAKEILVR